MEIHVEQGKNRISPHSCQSFITNYTNSSMNKFKANIIHICFKLFSHSLCTQPCTQNTYYNKPTTYLRTMDHFFSGISIPARHIPIGALLYQNYKLLFSKLQIGKGIFIIDCVVKSTDTVCCSHIVRDN